MKVHTRPPQEVEVVVTMTRDELQQFYNATRPGRRTRAEQRMLEQFGDLLVEGSPHVPLQLQARANGEDEP